MDAKRLMSTLLILFFLTIIGASRAPMQSETAVALLPPALRQTAEATPSQSGIGGKFDQQQSRWTDAVTEWHFDADAPNRLMILIRQLGTTTDTVDDTRMVTFTNSNGVVIETHSSAWEMFNLSSYLPVDAKIARLSFKAVITRQDEPGLATVYGFARASGSTCCFGPPGFENSPVDFSFPGSLDHPAIAVQAVAVAVDSGVRQFGSVDVPLRKASFDFAWGYRRMPKDAVAIGVYLNGWGR